MSNRTRNAYSWCSVPARLNSRLSGCRSAPASTRGLTMELGSFLSSEEHGPRSVAPSPARRTDWHRVRVDLRYFHLRLDEQGRDPFVWRVIGAVAATTRLRLTTAVTFPKMRIHPAVITHAAAAPRVLLDGRPGVPAARNRGCGWRGSAANVRDPALSPAEDPRRRCSVGTCRWSTRMMTRSCASSSGTTGSTYRRVSDAASRLLPTTPRPSSGRARSAADGAVLRQLSGAAESVENISGVLTPP